MILPYFGFIFQFALSHHWQNCNCSRTNKAIFKFVWNFQETCITFFFLLKFFSRRVDFTAPMNNRVNKRLGPELRIWDQTWKLEKVQKLGYSQKAIKKYSEKRVTKKLLLRKCHVRFILHFALAAEAYIWEKGIILL